jgi:predicted small secreted protein
MPMRTHLALLLLATLTVAGCGTLSSTGKSTRSSADADRNDASGPEDDYSPRAVERRTEAHARYAVAVLHDWEDESDLAGDVVKARGLVEVTWQPETARLRAGH